MAPRSTIVSGLAILAIGAGVGFAVLRPTEPAAYAAPGFEALTPQEAARESYQLAPEMLRQVYEAFAATDEAAVYDGLALVAGGDALDQLYLDRMGALAGGGLTESDQTIHEMRLIQLEARQKAETVTMDATWRVIGTVGHAEHMHVRGNVYSASLTLEPVDGAWRITGFDLRDIDRTGAGEMFEVPPEDVTPMTEADATQ